MLISFYNKTTVSLRCHYNISGSKDFISVSFQETLLTVATKIDKLNQKEKSASKKRFEEHFKGQRVVLTSTQKNIGLNELLQLFIEGN